MSKVSTCPKCGSTEAVFTAYPCDTHPDHWHNIARLDRADTVEAELLEIAYWEFDARRKGYGKWKGIPQAERDAFKSVVRGILNRISK